MDVVIQEVMRRDIYPAEVTMPDGTVHTGVRAFVTSARLLVYRESDGRAGCGYSLVFASDLAEAGSVGVARHSSQRYRPLEVALHDGTTAWINRGRGCGCGSPLKTMGLPVPWTVGRS